MKTTVSLAIREPRLRRNERRSSMACRWAAAIGACLALAGCQSPPSAPPVDKLTASNERHMALFGDFDLPRKIGTVENVHLQVPVFSPDGTQLMYLRTDQDALSPMTLLGSPADTPNDGTLSVWIRLAEGNGAGRRLSSARWAHSAAWSHSGSSVLFVVNEPPGSAIVHVNLTTGEEHRLGVPGAINCLPRFSVCDDEAVLFCTGKDPNGSFRVARQTVSEAAPTLLTPEGMDCLSPIQANCGGQPFCARADGERLNWASCGREGVVDLAMGIGSSRRPEMLALWSGIAEPLAPDGRSTMFYDSQQDRIGVYHASERRLVRHRTGSIAACWLSENAIALATDRGVFAVNTVTGFSPTLFDGTWVPVRYVPATRRLLLLGRENAARFSIVEVVFKTAAPAKQG